MARFSISQIRESFKLLFDNIYNDDFKKTFALKDLNEQSWLTYVRFFLLGYFNGELKPEISTLHPLSNTGYGRFDFMIANTAIEFAVRNESASKYNMMPSCNSGEICKLLKHNGPSVLVLFDFSSTPCSNSDLDEYRHWKSLGLLHGNHLTSPFNILYYYRAKQSNFCIQKQIRS